MKYYNRDNICDGCKIEKLRPGNACREYYERNWTGKWLCEKCRNNYRYYGTYEKPIKKYNLTNACDRCGISFDKASGHPMREYDKNGKKTEKWICSRCRAKDYNDMPYSHSNIIKQMRSCRTGNQNPNSSNAKGDLFEELTCKWRSTVSTVPVENLNEKLDNYTTPIDHTRDSELGIIQTKGKFYDSEYRMWLFCGLEREWDKKFDVIICYCASEDGKTIDRIYIIPKKETDRVKTINIVNSPMNSRGTSPIVPWYEKYRIKNEEAIDKINDMWKEIIKGSR